MARIGFFFSFFSCMARDRKSSYANGILLRGDEINSLLSTLKVIFLLKNKLTRITLIQSIKITIIKIIHF